MGWEKLFALSNFGDEWSLRLKAKEAEHRYCSRAVKVISFTHWRAVLILLHCILAQLCLTLCDPMDCSIPGFPVYHPFLELAQTHAHQVTDAIQPSHPLSSPSPPPFNLSQHQVFSNESVPHIRWPKYWSFSFSISPSNEYSRLISFRIDRFDLLAVQGTLKSLLQHHISKASINICILESMTYTYIYTHTLVYINMYTKIKQMDGLWWKLESKKVSCCWSETLEKN